MQSSDVFSPSPRPSTSNPKLRHFTTSPVVYNANVKDHEEHVSPRNTSPAAGRTTSAIGSGGGLGVGVGVGAKMVELDPAILWSTEADVPISMLARPSTSNPRYVEALLSSQNPSNAVSPTAANIAALYGSQMHLKQQTSPHQHQTLNSSDRQSPTATITSENNSNVHENIGPTATANDSSHPARSATQHHHHQPQQPSHTYSHHNPQTHFRPVTPRAHAEPSAPVLWSDGVGGVDTKLLARPVTANPWLQRVFDSVDIAPQVDQTAEDEDEVDEDEDEDYTPMVGGGEGDAVAQTSGAIPSNTIDDAKSSGYEEARGKKFGTCIHRGNLHSKHTVGSYTYNNVTATRRPVDLDPVGSYTIWSREEPRPNDAMMGTEDVREEKDHHIITELKKIIAHQQIEMATMRARIEALESLCAQANLITNNRGVLSPQQGGFVSYTLLPQTQESNLYQQPHPPAPAPGPSSRRASQKRASPAVGQKDTDDVGQRVSSIESFERPSSAVPNDPALAEAIRKSTSRFEKRQSSVTVSGAQTPPTAGALPASAAEIARELANAVHVDTPPPKMQKASDVSSNGAATSSTTTPTAAHHAIVDDDEAMVTEPLPDQSPISFGVPEGQGEESSPSPLRVFGDTAHKPQNTASENINNSNESAPNCAQLEPRALLVDALSDTDEAVCGESSGRKSREPSSSSSRAARPKTAIGHRRSSPLNNDAASAHPTTHHEEMPSVVHQKDGLCKPDGDGEAALPKLKLADDDDDEAPFETFDVDVEEAKDREKHANEVQQKKKEENVLSAVSIFRNEKEPKEGRTTTTKSSNSEGVGAASNGEEDDRPRAAHRVIPPNPPSTAASNSGKTPQLLADNLLRRPSSRADSDIYIREDKGELSNEEEVERSFAKGYQRSPSVHNRNPGAPTSNTLAHRSVQFGLVPTTHGGAFNTGLSFPPRPESALPSRRAARLRNAVGQCRAVTSAPNRRSVLDSTKQNDSDVKMLRPGTAQARPSGDAQSTTTAAPQQVFSVPPRRCASAGLSRPFLDTTARHLGPTDKLTYGKQRDLDIRKEYANILRKGEHAVTKDDFKSLYMERAAEYGMMPSDDEVEDLMAPYCKEGADHLSLDEFGVLFLKMSAW